VSGSTSSERTLPLTVTVIDIGPWPLSPLRPRYAGQ
jgi:hypothetical protein